MPNAKQIGVQLDQLDQLEETVGVDALERTTWRGQLGEDDLEKKTTWRRPVPNAKQIGDQLDQLEETSWGRRVGEDDLEKTSWTSWRRRHL